MGSIINPTAYDDWYHSPRGRWIGECEFILLQNLLNAKPAESLLDVGCGTGYFSRRFSQLGSSVTAIDPDPDVLNFAQEQEGEIDYIQGDALKLPFPTIASITPSP